MSAPENKIALLGKRCFSQLLNHKIDCQIQSNIFQEIEEQFNQQSKMMKKSDSQIENYGYEFYRKIGSPKYFVAPMVDQSELPYRMLTRKYNAQICYTPMFHSRLFANDASYRKRMFKPHPEDRPLVVQFCANDPQLLLNAAKYVEDHCDAVDINLGCPQGIARKGNYGSFLLEKTELIVSMVKILRQNLKIPVTCKIRCLPSEEETLHLAKEIQKAGASLLTVHGRTRDHNKQTVGPCNYQIIKKIKETLSIPVVLNGGISDFKDAEYALNYTKCDGVMSSESILEYPALFEPSKIYDLDDLCLEYLDFYEKYPGEATFNIARAHIHKFLHSGFNLHGHGDLRERLNNIDAKPENFIEIKKIAQEMKERRKNVNPIDKITWYYRHWKGQYGDISVQGIKNKEQLEPTFIVNSPWDSWMKDDPRNPQSQKLKDEKEQERLRLKEQKRIDKIHQRQNKNLAQKQNDEQIVQ